MNSKPEMANNIKEIFSEVPKRYELINHILTFGMDILWRRKAVKIALTANSGDWLDMCTGTGETAIYLNKNAPEGTKIHAADFSPAMIAEARKKTDAKNINFVSADIKASPFPDNSFDLITMSFATRNINLNKEALIKSFSELNRVLKPGGLFVNLETSQPPFRVIRICFHLYMNFFVAQIGGLISRSKTGYGYLAKSIPLFYSAEKLAAIMLQAGFDEVTFQRLMLGATAIHQARKNDSNFLHLNCGDISGQILRDSSIPGDVQVWMEIFIEGPAPGNISEVEWRIVRSRFISSQYFLDLSMEAALQGADNRYQKLEDAKNYKEVILWFDACMFDQTIMIHLIDRLSKIDLTNTKLSLICVGEFPGFDSFNGLGELSPEQTASLFDTRHEITKEEIKLASLAWKAFTSNNPEEIEKVISGDTSALPYLGKALKRFLQKYPSTANGLNRTQNGILKSVFSGTDKLSSIFEEVSSFEKPRFMGDTSFWQVLYDLANAKIPLLVIEGPENLDKINKVDSERLTKKELRKWNVSLTNTGKKVLKNEEDYILLNGIDCWFGGVQLSGKDAQWRWDKDKQILIQNDKILDK